VWAQPCQVSEIVTEAIKTVAPLVEKYELSLHTDWPEHLPQVLADFRRTTQVVVNLLSNAVKWGPSGSEILVEIRLEGDMLAVSVSDQGTGVSEEAKPGLFNPFGTGTAGEGDAHGTGLGLSVVKAIVEAQGGQVGVVNRAGGGARFWFTIPCAKTGLSKETE
jgi:signal transduction histidine kinase